MSHPHDIDPPRDTSPAETPGEPKLIRTVRGSFTRYTLKGA
jgi:hypothetical protein